METTLLTIGIVCVVAAIVGGGMKLMGNEMPVLASKGRQALLAIFGIALIIASQFIDKKAARAIAGATTTTDSTTQKITDTVKPVPHTDSPVVVTPQGTTNILLNYANFPEYTPPGSESVIRVNTTSQDNTSKSKVLVILTSPAGTTFKQTNSNVVTGYTDDEGNFLANFVYPSLNPSLSYLIKIEALLNNIHVAGNITMYSTTYASIRKIKIRPVQMLQKAPLKAVQVKVLPHN